MFDKLLDAMSNMREQESIEIVNDLLSSGEDPLQILDTCTRAMESVCERFESGEYFLPELIMAGEILPEQAVDRRAAQAHPETDRRPFDIDEHDITEDTGNVGGIQIGPAGQTTVTDAPPIRPQGDNARMFGDAVIFGGDHVTHRDAPYRSSSLTLELTI